MIRKTTKVLNLNTLVIRTQAQIVL